MSKRKMIALRGSGTLVEQEEFGQIFGGGMKKALNKPVSIKVGGRDLFFTAKDTSLLQAVVSEMERQIEMYQLGYWPVGEDPDGRERYRYVGKPNLQPRAIEQQAPPPVLMLPSPKPEETRQKRAYRKSGIAPQQPGETLQEYRRRYRREMKLIQESRKAVA